MSSQTKFTFIIIAVIAAALLGGFLAVQFFLPQATMPHQQGIQVETPIETPSAPPEEKETSREYPTSFSSMGTIHNAEMRYGSFPVASYAWDFGDGETSTQANPTHSYTQTGTYTVRLTITSTDGKSYTDSQEVEVNPSPF